MNNGIKPCPFCQNSDCGQHVRGFAFKVMCGQCGAVGPWGDDEQQAIDLWNKWFDVAPGPGHPMNVIPAQAGIQED